MTIDTPPPGQKDTDPTVPSPPSLSRREFFPAKQDFDLFGAPSAAVTRPVGRPTHVPTEKNRRIINALKQGGWPQFRIAAALGISEPTLKQHYFSKAHLGEEVEN